jgi:hypothetical protein
MKFLVAIDAPSRYSRPPFGRFAYIQSQGRLVWRKEATGDIERLATLANEALEFLRGMSGSYKLGIYPWKDATETPVTAPVPAEETPPPAEPILEDQPPLNLGDQKPHKLHVKRKP